MEEVYTHKKFHCLYTKNIDLYAYFNSYTQLVSPFFKLRKKGITLKNLLGIENDDEYIILKHIMDPGKAKSTLIPKTFIPKRRFLESWANYELPQHDTKLNALNFLKKESREEKYKRLKTAKYYGKVVLEVEKNPEDDVNRNKNLHPLHDYLVCVRVESLLDTPGWKGYTPSQELWIPGNLTLEKIKDRIICHDDFQLANPTIENLIQSNTLRKMDLNKNGMFYIANNFYNDTRWRGNNSQPDYSIEVREWMKTKNINPGNVLCMQDVALKDIPMRFGYPYLYMHQGKCEHLLIITDARLMKHRVDVLFLEDYPLLKSFASIKGRYCVLCSIRLAKLCVMDCQIIPYEKGFICNTCALSYLFDSEGNKKSPFTLYKYVDRSAII